MTSLTADQEARRAADLPIAQAVLERRIHELVGEVYMRHIAELVPSFWAWFDAWWNHEKCSTSYGDLFDLSYRVLYENDELGLEWAEFNA